MLSPDAYNAKAGLMLCCPITNQQKGYPFEVKVTGAGHVSGAALADQVKTIDWVARSAEMKGRVTAEVLAGVVAKVRALVEPS